MIGRQALADDSKRAIMTDVPSREIAWSRCATCVRVARHAVLGDGLATPASQFAAACRTHARCASRTDVAIVGGKASGLLPYARPASVCPQRCVANFGGDLAPGDAAPFSAHPGTSTASRRTPSGRLRRPQQRVGGQTQQPELPLHAFGGKGGDGSKTEARQRTICVTRPLEDCAPIHIDSG